MLVSRRLTISLVIEELTMTGVASGPGPEEWIDSYRRLPL